MNKRVKKLWLEALRSGKYKKVTNVLKDISSRHAKFCCLGVLCDLHRKETGIGKWSKDEFGEYSYLDYTTILPCTVREWAGLEDHEDPCVNECKYTTSHLSSLNDKDFGKRYSFDAIADMIEKSL